MQYEIVTPKVIHQDNIDNLLGLDDIIGTLAVRLEVLQMDGKERLPISFIWRYRIGDGNKDLYSIIIETKYLIYPNTSNNIENDLTDIIKNGWLQIKVLYEGIIEGSFLQGNVIPMIPHNDQSYLIQEILSVLRK